MSCNQIRAFGHEVHDVPRCYGGNQCIVTSDEITIPLQFKGGLCILPLLYPTDEDLESLEVIDLTADLPWRPHQLPEATDEWFDTLNDPMEGEDESVDDLSKFSDPSNKWGEYSNVLGMKHQQEAPNWSTLQKCFLWKSVEVVKKTLEATTQFAKTIPMRLPLRRHMKSRFPGLNVRFRFKEMFATDTWFASVKALGGISCVQVYVGKKSIFTAVFPMTTENQMAETLQDFIRKWGAPAGLFSDNAKSETSHAVKNILRLYNIYDLQSEPHYQNQNYAERRIQELKQTTNVLMDRTNTPIDLWYLCLEYVVYVLNHLAVPRLENRTPIEVAFGTTPDVSSIMHFHWYQQVYYHEPTASFPHSKERLGYFVGIADTVGDALTFKIWDPEREQVLNRSVVRPAFNDPLTVNQRLTPDGGEPEQFLDSENRSSKPILESETDCLDPSRLKLPTIDPELLMGFTYIHDEDGDKYRAEVIQRLEDQDKYIVKIGDSGKEEIVDYLTLVDHYLKEFNEAEEEEDGEKFWIYKAIIGHRKKGSRWEILVQWEDDTETWEDMAMIAKDDPITVGKYGQDNGLIDKPGWRRLR